MFRADSRDLKEQLRLSQAFNKLKAASLMPIVVSQHLLDQMAASIPRDFFLKFV